MIEKLARMREKRLKYHGNALREVKKRIGFLKNSAGFTLLELLVVISVIGILSGVGFYSFLSYSKKQSIDQAANDIKAGVEMAKFNAVSRVKPAGCGGAPLNRLVLKICTNATGQTNSCTDTSNIFQLDAACEPSILTINTKKSPGDIIVSILPAECGPDRLLQFYPLKNGTDVGFCRITLATTDSTLNRTLCVDGGGNVSIKEGSLPCP